MVLISVKLRPVAVLSRPRIWKTEKKLRVKTVTEELVGVGAEQQKKLVVWFTNDERGLVLNKTNNRTMRGAFGDDCAGWAGKIVVLFPVHDRSPRQDGAVAAGADSSAKAGDGRRQRCEAGRAGTAASEAGRTAELR